MVNKIRYIFLIVGLLTLSDYLFPQASVYKPFLKKPSWTVEYVSWVPWTQTWVYQKDTIISSKTYEKIAEISNTVTPLFLREDSTIKTIYSYDLANSLENVYVDFNLTVGNVFVYGSSTGTVTVRDSVLINGQYNNHIKIDYGFGSNIDWTEGLLSSYGPNEYYFNNSTCFLMRVNCMCKNNQSYFSNGNLCNLSCGVTNVWDQQQNKNQIFISPNPSNGIFEMNTFVEFNGTIEIFDVTGRLVFKETVKQNNKIDISSRASGIYSIVIKDEKGVLIKTTKVVKE